MSEWIQLAMWVVGGLGLAIATESIRREISDSLKVHCRVCGAELDRPGGFYVPYAGAGFCVRCSRDLMKEVRK